jgi:hypothetical protein
VLYLFRRLLLCLTFAFLTNYVVFQLQILLASSISFLIYLIWVHPFANKANNYIELFNEGCLYCLIIVFSVFSDYIEVSSIKWSAGYCSFGIVILNILVNFSYIITLSIQPLISFIKRRKKSNKVINL